ncbi:hypothetical protein DFJ43DRAFT_1038294 [Lentinula guzmanii]|uniref:GIT Spa2 homology (SHD) domain-containing protein n=1 Tax=Lentinula guzmanii TaxID=2804957 RepID=A0AA38JC65_9AGAR|nr:hypothetical protein DFJ43DRAFT_1038294 [Lentinula guzmanii]
MKCSQSRAASPTPTAFSGISNHRTDSYKPTSKNAPPVPQIDYRSISKIHYDELHRYLTAYLARAPPNSRPAARQKLTRLTISQSHELSTDVYDELIRRKSEKEGKSVRAEFHPKRNQARQKLATLPTSKFEDLSSDVYFELARRYPEFKEDPAGRIPIGSNYDDYPASGFLFAWATRSRTPDLDNDLSRISSVEGSDVDTVLEPSLFHVSTAHNSPLSGHDKRERELASNANLTRMGFSPSESGRALPKRLRGFKSFMQSLKC